MSYDLKDFEDLTHLQSRILPKMTLFLQMDLLFFQIALEKYGLFLK